jgi:hypothetical protein
MAIFLSFSVSAETPNCVAIGDLVWATKTTDGGMHDKGKTFLWYNTYPTEDLGGIQGAQCTDASAYPCDTNQYIEATNNEALCGFTDWRLPTLEELLSLVEIEYEDNINPNKFPNNDGSDYRSRPTYWTADTYSPLNTQTWAVDFYDGNPIRSFKSESYKRSVRLVRGPRRKPQCIDLGALTWEQKSIGGGLHSKNNTLNWLNTQDPAVEHAYNVGIEGALGSCLGISTLKCNTQAFVDELNSQGYCGYTDWRLPTLNELETLVDLNFAGNIDPSLFPNNDGSDYYSRPTYWSADTFSPLNTQAWAVDFYDGNPIRSFKSESYKRHARLVRGPKFRPHPACIQENGLYWEIKNTGGGLHSNNSIFNWLDPDPTTNGGNAGTQGSTSGCVGLDHCDSFHLADTVNNQVLCGFDDWRIPTLSELEAIVDIEKPGNIDDTLFPNNDGSDYYSHPTYWTANTSSSYSTQAWAINFTDGTPLQSFKSASYQRHARLVSSGQSQATVTKPSSGRIDLSSSDSAEAAPVTGTLSAQLDTLNTGLSTISESSWQSVKRTSDNHQVDALPCDESGSYLYAEQYIDGADEVTLNNCDSAFYRYTFDLPADYEPMCLYGRANVDDQGVLFLNGNRISMEMHNPGCDPAQEGVDDACYAQQDFGKDFEDAQGVRKLTAPRPDVFKTCDINHFNIGGVNELVFGVAGDAAPLTSEMRITSTQEEAFALPVTGTLSEQLDTLNAGPPEFSTETWQATQWKEDSHLSASFSCQDNDDSTFLSANQYITGANEVTLDNCQSAFYRFTFDLPEGHQPICLTGMANVDDQGVLFLNGHRISAAMNNPGCNPASESGDDPCYEQQDAGTDRTDNDGLPALTWPTMDSFETCDASHFVLGGENELIFAIAGDASPYEPTGLEFEATLSYAIPKNAPTGLEFEGFVSYKTTETITPPNASCTEVDGDVVISDTTYEGTATCSATNNLSTSGNVKVGSATSTADVTFTAGNRINLQPGFAVLKDSSFHASIAAPASRTASRALQQETNAAREPHYLSLGELPKDLWKRISLTIGGNTLFMADADQRFIVFSTPIALTPLDVNQQEDVYLYAVEEQILSLVSASLSGQAGDGRSFQPRIDGEGRYVVFTSNADDLVENSEFDGLNDVFAYEIGKPSIRQVSTPDAGSLFDGDAQNPTIATKTGEVVFDQIDPGSETRTIMLGALDGKSFISAEMGLGGDGDSLASRHHPIISADGRWIAWLEQGQAEENGCRLGFKDRSLAVVAFSECPAEIENAVEIGGRFVDHGETIEWMVAGTGGVNQKRLVANPLL